jgi:hypothetical protein
VLETESLNVALELVGVERQVAFAAASLDMLVRRFGRLGPGAEVLPPELLDEGVEVCWRSISAAPDDLSQIEALYARARAILADDDEGRLGVGEHVLAGFCYALRCAELRDSGSAVLVANNLYEAADYAAIIEDSSLSDEEILAQPVVVAAIQSIFDLLARVQATDPPSVNWVEELRSWTSSFGPYEGV